MEEKKHHLFFLQKTNEKAFIEKNNLLILHWRLQTFMFLINLSCMFFGLWIEAEEAREPTTTASVLLSKVQWGKSSCTEHRKRLVDIRWQKKYVSCKQTTILNTQLKDERWIWNCKQSSNSTNDHITKECERVKDGYWGAKTARSVRTGLSSTFRKHASLFRAQLCHQNVDLVFNSLSFCRNTFTLQQLNLPLHPETLSLSFHFSCQGCCVSTMAATVT